MQTNLKRTPSRISFEFTEVPETPVMAAYKVVALNSRLKDYDAKAKMVDGQLKLIKPAATVKDCRHIDGCVYFMLGRVPDAIMTDYIEKFQKVLKDNVEWKEVEDDSNFIS